MKKILIALCLAPMLTLTACGFCNNGCSTCGDNNTFNTVTCCGSTPW